MVTRSTCDFLEYIESEILEIKRYKRKYGDFLSKLPIQMCRDALPGKNTLHFGRSYTLIYFLGVPFCRSPKSQSRSDYGICLHFSDDTMSTMRRSAYSVCRLTNLQLAHMQARGFTSSAVDVYSNTRARARTSIILLAKFPSFSANRAVPQCIWRSLCICPWCDANSFLILEKDRDLYGSKRIVLIVRDRLINVRAFLQWSIVIFDFRRERV